VRHSAAVLRSDESVRLRDAYPVERSGELDLAETAARVFVPPLERLASACSAPPEPTGRQPPGGPRQLCPAGLGVSPQAHWAGWAARVLEPQLVERPPRLADASASEVVVVLQQRSRAWFEEPSRAAQRAGAPERSEMPWAREPPLRWLWALRVPPVLVRQLAPSVEPTPRAWPSRQETGPVRGAERAWPWRPWPLLLPLPVQPTGGNAGVPAQRGSDQASSSGSSSR